MRFTKMHGLGNDYVYINGLEEDLSGLDLAELSRVLSDRHFGIGGDGIILVLPSAAADLHMRILNSDGSEAEMCGNGIRAFAKYAYERGLTAKTKLEVETGAGLIRPELTVEGGVVTRVRVDMGEPRLLRREIPMAGEPGDERVVGESIEVDGETVRVTCVSMGNPHCVLFVPSTAEAPVTTLGPRLEHHPLFPSRTNVEFVEVLGRDRLRMRVWERGAGETLACGTGATASAVAAVLNGRADRAVTIELLGGELQWEWAPDNHVFLTGPATEVFSGEVDVEHLRQA